MNDYTDLVETAARVGPVEALDDLYWSDGTGAQEFLDNNSAILTSARRMLTPSCRIPIRFEAEFFSDHSDDFQHIRNLAKALSVELRYLDIIGNSVESVAIGIDMLRLANISRRGLIVDLLVGIAIEGMALEGLRTIRRSVPIAECEKTILRLKELEEEREAYQDVVNRDREWEAVVGWEDAPVDMSVWGLSDPNHCGLDKEGQLALRDYVEHLSNLPASDKAEMHLGLDRKMVALSRLLRTELSLRHTRATVGAFPSELQCTDLIDPTSGIDPFTGMTFVYRQDGRESFTLYSPGPTRIDNGGKFGSWLRVASGQADLCLDSSDYEECCELTCTAQRPTLMGRVTQQLKKWIHRS